MVKSQQISSDSEEDDKEIEQDPSEHNFAASKATDHDVVGDETENNSANPQTLVVENQHTNPPEEPELMTNADYDALKKPGLGSNPGEDMDVCKCIVAARYRGTLNSRRAASPLVRLVEGQERWETSDHPQSVLPLNWGGIEPNRAVTCMVLKATANDRRHLALCHDEFCGPRSGLCRSGGIGNNNALQCITLSLILCKM
ncbi:uncharacterized protein TNCV_2842061 [Trichonephila clavipes]|uniref:Uncharacterized protein n=1 Tax=Trichonephila clavipes TaxID=2585209 RepID=A0A8X6RLK5_TRICX|nr:uncharacterized protein TNCV_2842061 [Trichonephila clavipes]